MASYKCLLVIIVLLLNSLLQYVVIKFLKTRQENADRLGVLCVNLFGYEADADGFELSRSIAVSDVIKFSPRVEILLVSIVLIPSSGRDCHFPNLTFRKVTESLSYRCPIPDITFYLFQISSTDSFYSYPEFPFKNYIFYISYQSH